MNTKLQIAISIFFPTSFKTTDSNIELSFEILKTIQSCFKCNMYFLLKLPLKYCACCICVFHYMITEPPKGHGEKMMGKRRASARYCNFFLFFLKKCASGSIPGSKIHTKMVCMLYPWELIEFYFRMGLTYKDNKSVQIFKYTFKYLESVKDQNTFYRFVSGV